MFFQEQLMKYRLNLFVVLYFFCLIPYANAQTNKSVPPCGTEAGKQLNFWLGEWDLTWPAEQWGGEKGELGRGRNTVIKILDDCIIQETFQFPAGNFNGRSLSVYSSKSKKWQQTWVDNHGGYLVFTGEFGDGKMILRTKPSRRNGGSIISRMVFKNIGENSFDWDWQRSNDDGKTWTDLWNIHYERKND